MSIKHKKIIESIKGIIDTHNIECLNPNAYKFITLHMGFIAHYSFQGFKAHYRDDIPSFITNLITGEITTDPNYNERHGREYLDTNGYFQKRYGKSHCSQVGSTIMAIIRLAKGALKCKRTSTATKGSTLSSNPT